VSGGQQEARALAQNLPLCLFCPSSTASGTSLFPFSLPCPLTVSSSRALRSMILSVSVRFILTSASKLWLNLFLVCHICDQGEGSRGMGG
jgi:hypothetical protein